MSVMCVTLTLLPVFHITRLELGDLESGVPDDVAGVGLMWDLNLHLHGPVGPVRAARGDSVMLAELQAEAERPSLQRVPREGAPSPV